MRATLIETAEQAERHLASLDPIGWRFGLERIRLLLAELGEPQRRYRTIHVVGTNGKTSVTELSAAILAEAGCATGATVSPHVHRWSERILIDGEEIAPAAFAAAVATTAHAAADVDARLEPPDRLTQFEVAIAVAFLALAEAGVEWAVIEAGLGGRLDATNVLDSVVTALPSISLEHTDLLGESEAEIAGEKLAVLREGTALVAGPLAPEIERLARDHAEKLDARFVSADPGSVPQPRAGGRFARANLAVAAATVEIALGRPAGEEVARVGAGITLRGRAELRDGDPPLLLDAAHNPGGAAALAEALRAIAGGRPVVGCVALLEGKDVEGFIRALEPALATAVCTELAPDALRGTGRPGARTVDPELLVREFAARGVPARVARDPGAAVELTRELARAAGGLALITGTHYLLRHG